MRQTQQVAGFEFAQSDRAPGPIEELHFKNPGRQYFYYRTDGPFGQTKVRPRPERGDGVEHLYDRFSHAFEGNT